MSKNNPSARVLITGGAGFIGCHVVRHFLQKYPDITVVNLDRLTYAGNLDNLTEVSTDPRYRFVRGCVSDLELLREMFAEHQFTGVLHLAAESHVDRSIADPLAFVKANVLGTATLLQAARESWQGHFEGKRFLHVSTDEVFGSLGSEGAFTETTAYDPRSPYSASKASSDHFARAYFHTYGLPVVLSNCSNNYGPNQFPEKLIPVCLFSILEDRPIPVYGKGHNIRDWLYVGDHAQALDEIFHRGRLGESYNVGGRSELSNLALVETLCDIVDEVRGAEQGTARKQITFVEDRLGHDFRYAIDCSKLESELNWRPQVSLSEGLKSTVRWYLENTEWCDKVRTGSHRINDTGRLAGA